MPIYVPFQVTCLSTKEFGELDYKVMKHVFTSQNTLGRFADESVYQHDVANRLETVGFNVAREVAITTIK